MKLINKIGNKDLIISNKNIDNDDSKKDIQINIIKDNEDGNNNKLNNKFDDNNLNKEITLLKNPNKRKFNNNDYEDEDDNDNDFYKLKDKKKEKITLKNKRDTTKDIIMPKNLNDAYNLLKKNSYQKNETLREFKDDVDKF